MSGFPLRALALAALMLPACSTLRITPQPGQRTLTAQGREFVVSAGTRGMVWIGAVDASGLPSFATRLPYRLHFRNLTAASASLGLQDVSASDGSGRPLRLYTARDMERLERTSEFETMAARMDAASRAFAAPLPNFTDYSVNYGGFGAPGTAGGLIFNPAQAAVVAQSHDWNRDPRQQAPWISRMLTQTNVPAGATAGALLIVEKAPVTILRIRAAGEEFTARFLAR